MQNKRRAGRRGKTSRRKSSNGRHGWYDEDGLWTDRPPKGVCEYGLCPKTAYRILQVPIRRGTVERKLCWQHFSRGMRYIWALQDGKRPLARGLAHALLVNPSTLEHAAPNHARAFSDAEVKMIEALDRQGMRGVEIAEEVNRRRAAEGKPTVNNTTVRRRMPSSKTYSGPYEMGE